MHCSVDNVTCVCFSPSFHNLSANESLMLCNGEVVMVTVCSCVHVCVFMSDY